MTLWRLFAQRFGQVLRDNRRISLDETIDIVRQSLAQEEFSNSQIDAMIVEFKKHQDDVFSFGAVINPKFLETRFGKRVFLYLVSGGTGVFGTVSDIADELQGDISRYVTYGTTDSILVLFGSDDEARALEDELVRRRLIIDPHRVLRVPLFKGFEIPTVSSKMRSSWATITSQDLESVDLLVRSYWQTDLSSQRDRLLNDSVLLGRSTMEDLRTTNHPRAFVGIKLYGGPKRQVITDYFRDSYVSHDR